MSKVLLFILSLTIPQVVIFDQENTRFISCFTTKTGTRSTRYVKKKVILLISIDNLFLVKLVVFSTIDNVARGSYRGDLWQGSRTEKIEDQVSCTDTKISFSRIMKINK